MDEQKFCKDCVHVDKNTLKFSLEETRIECLRILSVAHTITSAVTGKQLIIPATKYYCYYERSLGGCQHAEFFKRSEKEL